MTESQPSKHFWKHIWLGVSILIVSGVVAIGSYFGMIFLIKHSVTITKEFLFWWLVILTAVVFFGGIKNASDF